VRNFAQSACNTKDQVTGSWKAKVLRWPFPVQAAILGLVLAVISYFPIFTGKVPFPADLLHYFPISEGTSRVGLTFRHAELGDLFTLMYPWRVYLRDSLRQGELPFWNPHSFAGAPFLANPISAVFYPPNWLFVVLPVNVAWSIQFPLRLGLAVFFMALFARRLGASRLSAVLAGSVFAMCGFMTGWQGWPQADVLLWLPLIMLTIVRLRRRPGLRSAVLLALAFTPPLLAGHPEVCLYVCSFAVCFFGYMGFRAIHRGRRFSWAVRYCLAFGFGVLLAASLAAVQLVPASEWIPEITRGLSAPWGSHPLRNTLALVSRDTKSGPNPSGLEVPNEACYVGMASLILAPLAVASRRRGGMFFAIAGFSVIGAAFGVPPFSTVFRALPVFRAMPGIRLVGILDVCLAVLAGLGLTELQRAERKSRRRFSAILIVAATLAVAAAVLILRAKSHPPPGNIGTFRSYVSTLGLLAASTLFALLSLGRSRGRWGIAALVVVTLLDLGSYAWHHVPPVPSEAIFPPTPTTSFLQSDARLGDRIVFLDRTAPRGIEFIYGLDLLEGYPQVLRRTNRLFSPLNGGAQYDILRVFRTDALLEGDRALLNRLGVRFLVASTTQQPPEVLARLGREFPLRFADGSNLVFENPNALSRVWVSNGGPCQITNLSLGENGLSGLADCLGAARIVVAQTFYPGWEVTVGQEPGLVTSLGELCSFSIPAGSHAFALKFRPSHFGVAIALSVAALIIIVVCLIVTVVGRRAAESHSEGGPNRRGHPRPPTRREPASQLPDPLSGSSA
jgi:Bacterial membrane protein YfhO